MNSYFYDHFGQQAGPVSGDQLITNGVTAETLVWREGMAAVLVLY